MAANASPVRAGDLEAIATQLGREPRGVVGIGARCACGKPAVTITLPRLADGSPFPTLFYLSLPYVVREMSRLEADGRMAEMTAELTEDTELATAYQRAHESYIARREVLGQVPEISNVSAGGMPTRVKCLHALAGYALAVGEGVCPIGDRALEMSGWQPDVCHCEED
ncbi:septum formation initiator family protein [Actinobaculum suis]|nr:septum formation initiator family protein [Actinobaculum suis]OCA93176.1 septum formation initiator family protein [Actinobaculum suis]OCA93565.1 septum formation initiator family protein [Actinobaculum suis]